MGTLRSIKGTGIFHGLDVKHDIKLSYATLQRMVGPITISGAAGNGVAFAWEVPVDCMVGPVLCHTVDPPDAARTINIGVTDAANVFSDILWDDYQIGTLVGKNGNSIRNAGSNGRGIHYAAKGQFVTGTNSSALTGTYQVDIYINYTPLGES